MKPLNFQRAIPFSATDVRANTPENRRAFREKLGLATGKPRLGEAGFRTGNAQRVSRGMAKANRSKMAAVKRKMIPGRTKAMSEARGKEKKEKRKRELEERVNKDRERAAAQREEVRKKRESWPRGL